MSVVIWSSFVRLLNWFILIIWLIFFFGGVVEVLISECVIDGGFFMVFCKIILFLERVSLFVGYCDFGL